MLEKESNVNAEDEENNILTALKKMKVVVVPEAAASNIRAEPKKEKLVLEEPGPEPGQEREVKKVPYLVVNPKTKKPDANTPSPGLELGARAREASSLAYPALDVRGDRRAELRRRTEATERDVNSLINKSAIRIEIWMEHNRRGIVVF